MRWGHTLKATHPALPALSAPLQPPPVKKPTKVVDGRICPIRRKIAKRKAKDKVRDPVFDVMTKELSTLRTKNVKNNTMFQ